MLSNVLQGVGVDHKARSCFVGARDRSNLILGTMNGHRPVLIKFGHAWILNGEKKMVLEGERESARQ